MLSPERFSDYSVVVQTPLDVGNTVSLIGVCVRSWGPMCDSFLKDDVSCICSKSLHREWSQYFVSARTNGHPNNLKSD